MTPLLKLLPFRKNGNVRSPSPTHTTIQTVNVHPRKLKCSKMAFNTDLGQEEKENVVHPGEGSSCEQEARSSLEAPRGASQRTTKQFLAGSYVLPPGSLATMRTGGVYNVCTCVMPLNVCIGVSRWPHAA